MRKRCVARLVDDDILDEHFELWTLTLTLLQSARAGHKTQVAALRFSGAMGVVELLYQVQPVGPPIFGIAYASVVLQPPLFSRSVHLT